MAGCFEHFEPERPRLHEIEPSVKRMPNPIPSQQVLRVSWVFSFNLMASTKRNWTHDELLVCFNFYCRTPFGKLHRGNPDIIKLAALIGRTPSAFAMKASNFASFDPAHQKRGVKGLRHAGPAAEKIWKEFNAAPNQLAEESEDAALRVGGLPPEPVQELIEIPSGPTEKDLVRPMRLVQSFFRRTVLASYKFTCAFCGLE